jgi:hypothetical protein
MEKSLALTLEFYLTLTGGAIRGSGSGKEAQGSSGQR